MGYYIEVNSEGERLPVLGKARALILDGAKQLPKPPLKATTGDGSRPFVCVVNNGDFEAAAWINSGFEIDRFSRADDPRPKIWLSYPHAEVLAR